MHVLQPAAVEHVPAAARVGSWEMEAAPTSAMHHVPTAIAACVRAATAIVSTDQPCPRGKIYTLAAAVLRALSVL